MKFKVTLKDPDFIYEGIQEAAKTSVNIPGLTEDEKDGVIDSRVVKLGDFCMQWVECGEYITIEFDTEANTATVLRRS